MNLNRLETGCWQSQLQHSIDATPANYFPCFERFQASCPSVLQLNQSIALIDFSCPVNNQSFLQTTRSTPKLLFSAASIESISVCTFNFVRDSEKKSPAQKTHRRINESEYHSFVWIVLKI